MLQKDNYLQSSGVISYPEKCVADIISFMKSCDSIIKKQKMESSIVCVEVYRCQMSVKRRDYRVRTTSYK